MGTKRGADGRMDGPRLGRREILGQSYPPPPIGAESVGGGNFWVENKTEEVGRNMQDGEEVSGGGQSKEFQAEDGREV
jgi:hypothetical protein